MTPSQAWNVLKIAKTPEVAAIRRAYAERLKAMDIDRDVDGYARLREARDAALRWARMQAKPAADEDFDPFAGAVQSDPPDLPPTPEPESEPESGLEKALESLPESESSSWLYAAPAAQGQADPSLTTRLSGAAPKLDVTTGFSAAQAPAEQAIAVARDPFTRPVLLGLEATSDAVMPAWAHEQALYRLLLTDLPDQDDEQDDLPPCKAGKRRWHWAT